MKRILRNIILLTLCASTVGGGVLTVYATEENPYGVNSVGCITDIKMESFTKLLGSASYFTSVVTSHIQGLEEKEAIPYKTYGAIGSDETKMFVYSVGSEDGLDFSMATVKEIVEAFERDNPHWKAVAAVNGDFFDIETKVTASVGEPEFPMIQLGDVYKSNVLSSAIGRGVVGTDADGNVVYYTAGSKYYYSGYGTQITFAGNYQLQLLGESRNNPILSYTAWADVKPMENRMAFITPDSKAFDLRGTIVYVVKCDTYRRAHVGINGTELGTRSYFAEGEIVEIREGGERESAPDGCVLLYTPNPELYEELKVGEYVKCQKVLNGDWEGVENAIGFKQQILAEGNILLKNCYGRYNTSGEPDTKHWTEDIYDYPYCWKHRTAIGFREDGTPVLLVIKKSIDTSEHSNLAASYYEIGEQLKALGCVNGFLLDGGGSSTMVIRDGEDNLVTVFNGEGEEGRKVANAVILAVRDMSVEEPTFDEPIEKPTEEPTEKPTEKPAEQTDGQKDVESAEASDATGDENITAAESDSAQNGGEDGSNTVTDKPADAEKGCGAAAAVPALATVTVGAAAVNVISKKKRKKTKNPFLNGLTLKDSF